MFFDQSDEIRGRVPGQRGFCEVRVRGDEVLRLAIGIREIAAPAAGYQDFFAGAIGSLKNRNAAPAFAGLNRAEESRGARAKNHGVKFVDRCMGQRSLAFVASDHHITYWPKASSRRYQIEPALPRMRRRAIQFHKVCYDADRFCRLDIPASPCDSEDVNSIAEEIAPGNPNFEVRSAGPDCSD